MRSFTLGRRTIDDRSDAYVIAEISHNHLGSMELAREMIRLAAGAGADAVKLQKRGASTYSGLRRAGEDEYAAMREAREFNLLQYAELGHVARQHGLDFLATAFDMESADFLSRVEVDAFKVASGDVKNTPLLREIARHGKPMIVSTGGADLEDVRRAYMALSGAGANFCLLHCTSEYPVSVGDVNLGCILNYLCEFPDRVIGFSSHVARQRGTSLECAAYALGARVFEKHVTLTPGIMTGEHAFALTFAELGELVEALRDTRQAIGDGTKRELDGERPGMLRLGKKLAYARKLPRGHVLSVGDLMVVAPGNGVPPNRIEQLVGRPLCREVAGGEDANLEDVESRACLAV